MLVVLALDSPLRCSIHVCGNRLNWRWLAAKMPSSDSKLKSILFLVYTPAPVQLFPKRFVCFFIAAMKKIYSPPEVCSFIKSHSLTCREVNDERRSPRVIFTYRPENDDGFKFLLPRLSRWREFTCWPYARSLTYMGSIVHITVFRESTEIQQKALWSHSHETEYLWTIFYALVAILGELRLRLQASCVSECWISNSAVSRKCVKVEKKPKECVIAGGDPVPS